VEQGVHIEPSIESAMEQYRRPAIMIRRMYPPHDVPPRNSRLGGRPLLPDGVDWPRAKDGVPFHFMAQIDCAELPPNGGVLPERGVLFFFARISDALWGSGDSQTASDISRVLYAPSFGKRKAVPPPGLLSALDTVLAEFRVPGDPPFGVFPGWPIEFRSVDSWPRGWQLPWVPDPDEENDRYVQEQLREHWRAYDSAVNKAESDQLRRLFGPWTHQRADWALFKHWPPNNQLAFPAARPDRPFPQVWVMIDRIARHLYHRVVDVLKQDEHRRKLTSERTAALSRILASAMEWVRAAAAQSLDAETEPDTARRFSAWLQELSGPSQDNARMAHEAIRRGVESAIQFAASSPATASRIPEHYYLEHVDHREPHQMLGCGAPRLESGEILLLHLRSDSGVDFMFGDCGDLTFRIGKDALAARRFHEAFATVDNG